MDSKDLLHLKTWFAGYCESFYTFDEDDQRNILLKERHTRNVCANALEIAQGLSFDEHKTALAEATALLHDVGRFPQYRQYKTFMDAVSVNHAALGAKVLLENNALGDIPRHEQDIIVRAVTLHNVFILPEALDGDTLLIARLVRDADKLDIWRVFREYYEQPEEDRASAAALDLPDRPEYSPDVLSCLQRGGMARTSMLKTLTDFKLLQISWVFDLNFSGSFRMIDERGHLDAIAASLPQADDIKSAVARVRRFIREKLRPA